MPLKASTLTTPDLVLLSLLAERPFHGYQAYLELERRKVREWAGVSRPQVYYSLEKLARMQLIHVTVDTSPAAGPDRRVYETTSHGRVALAGALDREDWVLTRERPPFLTWLALSWQASPEVVQQQIERRRKFLQKALVSERLTLRAIRTEVGHSYHEAIWMVTLAIGQMRTELVWLRKLKRDIVHRAPAKNAPR